MPGTWSRPVDRQKASLSTVLSPLQLRRASRLLLMHEGLQDFNLQSFRGTLHPKSKNNSVPYCGICKNAGDPLLKYLQQPGMP